MKIRIINIIEIILGAIFCITFLFKNDNSADLMWLNILSAFLLSILYFPLGFYTLKSTMEIHIANLFVYGLLFSLSISSIMLNLMGIEISLILLIIFAGILLALAIFKFMAVYLVSSDKFLEYDNSIVIRYLVLFGIMVYSIITVSKGSSIEEITDVVDKVNNSY